MVSDLVVTAASIDPLSPDLPAGDLYVCFEAQGVGDCPETDDSKRVFKERPERERLLKIVFASGAAFPILPARKVVLSELKGGGETFLIDGGYGHNVPFEAAGIVDARQVLVIRNKSEERRSEPASRPGWRREGQLARYLLRLFGFIFERIQAVDVRTREELVVASLGPTWEPGEEPFLADFRRQTIREVIAKADTDFTLRIGRIESWGLPGRPIFQIRAKSRRP